MVDDGGSNKVLRDEFGLLPTSGIRLALVALSTKSSLLRKLFTYRFSKGEGISGMTFGNLFLAAVADITGSQEKAIQETAQLLSVKGQILPISYDSVKLVAYYEDGKKVVGEHAIDEAKYDGTKKIKELTTEPKAQINKKAQDAIERADYIVLGPGDFYTNTVANLVIDGVVDAINKSKAKIIFIGNLMTKYGETYNYKFSDFLTDLARYIPMERLNYVVVNSDTKYPPFALEKYATEHAVPVEDDLEDFGLPTSVNVIRTPILSRKVLEGEKGDILKRSILRHDSNKLGEAIVKIISG